MRRLQPAQSAWLLPLLAFLACAACSVAPADFYQGYVEGEFVYVAAPVGGRIVELPVARGREVKAGELLFRLDPAPEQEAVRAAAGLLAEAGNRLADLRKGQRPSEIAAVQARLKAAQAAADLSAAELPRRKALYARGAIAREELDASQSAYDRDREQVRQLRAELTTAGLGAREDEILAAESTVAARRAELDQANWNLGQKSQVADRGGVVVDLLHYAGEWVAPGKPVISLLPPENRKLRFYVPETELGGLRLGQEVVASLDGAARTVACRIDFIAPRAEYTPPVIYSSRIRADLVFLVEARPDPADAVLLHPGQPAEVRRADAVHAKP